MWTSRLSESLKNHRVQIIASSVLSAAAGSAVTYVTLSKRLAAKYASISSREIAEARAFYKTQEKPDLVYKPSDPLVTGQDVEDAINHLAAYGGHVLNPDAEHLPEGQPEGWIEAAKQEALAQEDPRPPLIERNIFTDPLPDIPQHMINERDPETPYVIGEAEFFENKPEHIQDSYTYFEGDDILVDKNDQVILDRDRIIGTDALDRWGYGSEDVHMVYVRNEKLGLDVEIARDTGNYSQIVGFDEDETELKHSADHYRRKAFRRGEG